MALQKGSNIMNNSIWTKKWKWWHVVLLLGYTYMVASLISNGKITNPYAIMVAGIVLLIIFVSIIYDLGKNREKLTLSETTIVQKETKVKIITYLIILFLFFGGALFYIIYILFFL